MKQFTLICGCEENIGSRSHVWVESPRTAEKRYCSVLLAAYPIMFTKTDDPLLLGSNMQELYDRVLEAARSSGSVVLTENELMLIATHWEKAPPKPVEIPWGQQNNQMWELRSDVALDKIKYEQIKKHFVTSTEYSETYNSYDYDIKMSFYDKGQ